MGLGAISPPIALDVPMTRFTDPANHKTALTQNFVPVLLVLLAVSTSGCTSLRVPDLKLPALPFAAPPTPTYMGTEPGFEPKPELGEQIYNAVREAKARDAVVLQIVGDSTPVRVLPLPENGESVTVSKLLSQAGITKKLGSIDATLFRPSTGSVSGMPMAVKMASNGRSVRPECDYALRAGDRLRVQKSVSPAVEGLIQSLLGL